MGLFSVLKKGKYVNHLVLAFKMVYSCGDMAAIECLRKNYTEQELKVIFQTLKQSEKQGSLQTILNLASPFVEERDEVMRIDGKYKSR